MDWRDILVIIGVAFVAFIFIYGTLTDGFLRGWNYERNIWRKFKALLKAIGE